MSTFQIYINDDEDSGRVRVRVYGAKHAPVSDRTFATWHRAMCVARDVLDFEQKERRRAMLASGREPGR